MARWILTLIGKPPVFLKPLVTEIAEASGYSYETIVEYSELTSSTDELLEAALSAHLQMEGMGTETFDSDYAERTGWEILGSENDFVYLEELSKDAQPFGIVGEIPDSVPEELESELNHVWGVGVGAAGLAALTSNEVQRRYDVPKGVVLPRERLEDFPVELPERSELTEQYEALRLLQNNIEQVLSSSEAGVEYGDDSYCDLWYRQVHERLVGNDSGLDSLGAQQRDRLDFTAQMYRDCYGNGDQVTDFAWFELEQPDETEQLRLFGFGIFDHNESVQVPVSPESEEVLPIYPQSQSEFEYAVELLDEFPTRPNTATSS